ncbi:MAG: hypothetical protein IKV83_09720 [Muribaculaceae bacterium]|nr:hypothetical protein [Muribaculaceae bacterium]
MATDNKFTELIKQWLDTPADERDYAVGALYLLKLSGNQIMYRNIMANPTSKAEFIEYNIRKYYNFRVQALTHYQVEEMQKQVDVIAQEHFSLEEENPAKDFKKGKREDHDSLPDEIQALYVENLSIVQRMREVHLKLRSLSADNATCPDSERYPFLKELIELDKRLHSNWEQYDHFVGTQSDYPKETATKKVAKKKATKKS